MAKFSLKGRIKSFAYAFQGIKWVYSQHNMWIHTLAAILAISLGFYLHISTLEWIAIILCIFLVFAAEMINTAIEFLADEVDEDHNLRIGKVKDLAAGAVLMISIASALIGALIFVSKFV